MAEQLRVGDVFATNPITNEIPNEGVAEVDQEKTLRWELQNFVCEGQYAAGLDRVLRSYLTHQGSAQQPGVWVSGFYGSGKSHLVKVLRHLWTDTPFEDDGATPRDLAKLPADIMDGLTELSTLGKRGSGLHAAAGKLQYARPLRRDLLAILFRSMGMPEDYPVASFVMWMRGDGVLDQVTASVEAAGKQLRHELRNMYVSPVLADALLDAIPAFAADGAAVRAQLRAQFPPIDQDDDITDQQMLDAITDLLAVDGDLPCTLIVLDELQQYIGGSAERATDVQYVTEACTKHFGDRLLFVGTGQAALSAEPLLQKLQGRFTVQVELADTDVEKVTRSIVLAKAPDKVPAVDAMLTKCSGEIDRQLRGTRIGPRPEDQLIRVADYPILPVRRRFWERVLRAVDRAGTAAQLRTQLRTAHEAARSLADRPLGAVVPGDFLYDQQSTALLQAGVLLKDIHETILAHKDGTPEGELRSRVCALCWLIGELPREPGVDIGVAATPEMIADLLVDDLSIDSSDLRARVPEVLADLEKRGHLMRVGDEYQIQTPEGSAWLGEFNSQFSAISNSASRVAEERAQLLRQRCGSELQSIRLIHGASPDYSCVVRKENGRSVEMAW